MVSFDPSKPGKYRVQVGDSLLESGNPRTFASVRYNSAPADEIDVSSLKLEDDGNFSLTLDSAAGQEAKYAGVQRPGRKLECLLVYNPATNSFSLERVDSTFTFNQTHPATSEPEIPIFAPADLIDSKDKDNKERDESPLASDDEVNLADAENPFDVRHFLKLVKESDSESEAEESEKGDEMDEDEADGDVEMTPLPQPVVKEPSPEREPTPPPAAPAEPRRAPPAPAAGVPTKKALPRKKKEAANPFMKPTRRVGGAKSPNAGASPAVRSGATTSAASSKAKDSSMSPQSTLPSPAHTAAPISLGRMGKKNESSSESESDEDDSDEDDSDEDARPSRPSAPISRSPAVQHKEAPRSVSSFLGNRNEPEELDLNLDPTPSHGNQNNADADDESDEDAEDEDGLDLLAEMEAAFEGGDDGGLVIEGETDAPKGIGLGIGGIGSVGSGQAPISINGMMGNSSRRDESEESSSEEE